MILKIMYSGYRLRKWVLKKPYGERFFAFLPHRAFETGNYHWLEFMYRYRTVGYEINVGEVKKYIYELEDKSRKQWCKRYYKNIKKELKEYE